MKQEDRSDKIEMLRKIEGQLDFLCEVKDYVARFHPKELREVEGRQAEKRRTQRIKNQQMREKLAKEEKQRKNEARIRKQDELKISMGRKS